MTKSLLQELQGLSYVVRFSGRTYLYSQSLWTKAIFPFRIWKPLLVSIHSTKYL